MKAKNLLYYLSDSLERIYVDNNDIKEAFELAIHVHLKSCIVEVISQFLKDYRNLLIIFLILCLHETLVHVD